MDDVRAVTDAAVSKKAALFGISEGGPMCIVFAATYPERTSALVLYGTFGLGLEDSEYPRGVTSAQLDRFLDRIGKDLVTGSGLGFVGRAYHNLKGIPGEWNLFNVEHCRLFE